MLKRTGTLCFSVILANTINKSLLVLSDYDKASVTQFNFDHFKALNSPIARINAIHNNSFAAAAKPDDTGDLYPVIFLSVGARTANLWQEEGLCNGAAGTVQNILYQEGHQPPSLPTCRTLLNLILTLDHDSININSNAIPISSLIFE